MNFEVIFKAISAKFARASKFSPPDDFTATCSSLVSGFDFVNRRIVPINRRINKLRKRTKRYLYRNITGLRS